MKIREIKYPQMFKSYIACISKTSRLAKLSTCKNDRNFQFAKLSPREIKVFYSRLLLLPNPQLVLLHSKLNSTRLDF